MIYVFVFNHAEPAEHFEGFPTLPSFAVRADNIHQATERLAEVASESDPQLYSSDPADHMLGIEAEEISVYCVPEVL